MLPPSYLDQMPDAFVQLWQQVEDDILRDVARRISKMDTMTPTANWQLWRYEQTEALRQDVVKKLARYTGKSESEIRRLMQEAATRAMEAEDEIYYHYGKEPTPFADNATLQALLNAGYQQTAGTFHNLTATTANTVSGQFEAALGRHHDVCHLPHRPHRHAGSGRPPGGADWCEPDRCKAAGGPGR